MTKSIFRLGWVLIFVCLFPWMGRANTLYFPQVTAGGGYSTTFTLLNIDSIPLNGQLRILNQDGTPRSVPFEWESVSIPAAGSARFTLNSSGDLTVGWAYFQSAGNVNGVAVFERRKLDGTLETIASVLGVASGPRFLVPVEISASAGTGIALVNTANLATSVQFTLLNENGSTLAVNADSKFSSLGAGQQISEFVSNLFPQLALTDFKGTLIIEAGGLVQRLAATGLVVKEGLLSGLPVIGSFTPPPPITGILMSVVGASPFSMIAFQKDPITSNGSYPFKLDSRTYEVSGTLSNRLAVFFGSASTSDLSPKVEAGSIRSNEGPVLQVFPCFILYSSSSGTPQPFRFQFTVSSNTGDTCNATVTTNPLFGEVSSGRDLISELRLIDQSIAIAGVNQLPGPNRNFFVRSFDSATGERRWQDEALAVPGLITSVFLTNMRGTLFLAAYSPSLLCCSDIFVRAYNASTGRILWTDIYDKGRDDLPQAIAVGSAAVVVVGYGGNTGTPPISGLDGLVRAYEPATGGILWEDRIDTGFLVDDVAWAVTIDGNRVLVTGTSSTSDGPSVPFLRTYNATNGTLLPDTSLPASSSSNLFRE